MLYQKPARAHNYLAKSTINKVLYVEGQTDGDFLDNIIIPGPPLPPEHPLYEELKDMDSEQVQSALLAEDNFFESIALSLKGMTTEDLETLTLEEMEALVLKKAEETQDKKQLTAFEDILNAKPQMIAEIILIHMQTGKTADEVKSLLKEVYFDLRFLNKLFS